MFLSSLAISQMVSQGQIRIEPFERNRLKPASYLLHLGSRFRRWKYSQSPIEIWAKDACVDRLEPFEETDSITIEAGGFVLACSIERISMPVSHLGLVTTLSHLARVGISLQLNANLVSPGFGSSGPTHLAFEIANHNPNPIRLRAGMPVGHLCIAAVSCPAVEDIVLGTSVYEMRDPLDAPILFEELSQLGLLRSPV